MAKTGEIITVHTGQGGIQLGNTTWELYCIEHGIKPDGSVCTELDPNVLNTFFSVTPSGKFTPRAVFIDTDPSVLDEIRTGDFRFLYHPKQLISGKEDTANCFARGYLTMGREMVDSLLERVRATAEECSHLQGFLLYRAVGGGTGSGLMCYFLELLEDDYGKASRIDLSIYPAPKLSPVIVEPYNTLLATHSSMSTVHCTLSFSNEAVYDICDRELDISAPTIGNINRVTSQVLSAFTSRFRFDGIPNVNLAEFQVNLVPYPRIHFPLVCYSPLVKPGRTQRENATVGTITNGCFEPCNQMLKCNSHMGKYFSCCLLYRGDVSTSEINSTLSSLKMKKSIRFVTWIPTRFKVGVNFKPPVVVPHGELGAADKACAMIANNTAVRSVWEKFNRKFDLMFSKKAFIHWYIAEGLEESDFLDTRMDMETLVSDYREIEFDT